MHYRYAVSEDAPALAELFAAHHYDALTERARADQGFVQGALDVVALRSMADEGSLLVAEDSGRRAGLLGLAEPGSMATPPPPVEALLHAQDALQWRGQPLGTTRWLLYGPVVVADEYRGKGVARGLFDAAARAASRRQADVMVAFIERANRISWHVHVDGFGMTPLGEFTVADRAYDVVGAATGRRGQSSSARRDPP
ncbi:GNAT family N-acetyltransferase [Streptomyces tsukubensis]|uniref:GNAT family N-acetyltransferase n=1 Tax=Streptomyces tsukubensis TaxID=83656 RepID=A0A1V4A2P7_9ACTN|nr:GNAT family N-acetyltransferase [Streptomyces tsukubensis]OON73824.1 GNAT family N-acetyltransferase [Streptomyces tsukubensis]QFR91806.1 GNAT family N-acetyltransferase [Streptomyces tsukubensis]